MKGAVFHSYIICKVWGSSSLNSNTNNTFVVVKVIFSTIFFYFEQNHHNHRSYAKQDRMSAIIFFSGLAGSLFTKHIVYKKYKVYKYKLKLECTLYADEQKRDGAIANIYSLYFCKTVKMCKPLELLWNNVNKFHISNQTYRQTNRLVCGLRCVWQLICPNWFDDEFDR